MERKGSFNKGHAGHVRNASTYRIIKEKFKKWRGPTITAFVLVLAFGLSPMISNEFQTSVLTSGETQQLVDKDPALARKNIVEYAQGLIKECQTFELQDCVDEGNQLMSSISNEALDVHMVFTAVVDFEQKTVDIRAKAACKYQAPKYLQDLKDAQSKMATFADAYGSSLSLNDVNSEVKSLQDTISKVEATLKTCSQ